VAAFRLAVRGHVNQALSLSLADLLAMPRVELVGSSTSRKRTPTHRAFPMAPATRGWNRDPFFLTLYPTHDIRINYCALFKVGAIRGSLMMVGELRASASKERNSYQAPIQTACSARPVLAPLAIHGFQGCRSRFAR
jgi:hypothetical protein